MIVEYKLKDKNGWCNWRPINTGILFNDLQMDLYSIRINKDRQYHILESPGFKEAYNKSISWMKLTGKYDEEWKHL